MLKEKTKMARTNARCVSCGNIFPVSEMLKGNPLDRGGKPGYICEHCQNLVTNYSRANNNVKGINKSENYTCSIELEVSMYTPIGKANLMHNGFMPSSDCSVFEEMKSPIYNGFGGIVKYAKSIEKMLNSGDLEINRTCGAHMHIGRTDIVNHLTGHVYDFNNSALDVLWAFRYDILRPLSDYLSNNPDKCANIFGRKFNQYADSVENAFCNSLRSHDNRYCFINFCSSHNTIEFRINFFRNAAQFGKMVMLEKAMFSCMVVNFLDYWDAGDDNHKLSRQAQKTGEKLLRLFQKAEND